MDTIMASVLYGRKTHKHRKFGSFMQMSEISFNNAQEKARILPKGCTTEKEMNRNTEKKFLTDTEYFKRLHQILMFSMDKNDSKHMNTHTHTHTHTYAPLPVPTHTLTHIHTHTHTHTSMCGHILTYRHRHRHTHTYIYTYIYTYIHIYIHSYILTYIHCWQFLASLLRPWRKVFLCFWTHCLELTTTTPQKNTVFDNF